MISVEILQLLEQYALWRENLRNSREELTIAKAKLQSTISNSFNSSQLLQVERLHNQFHIQLINIHDLKHDIKNQMQKLEQQNDSGVHMVDADATAAYDDLTAEYTIVQKTLSALKHEFTLFLNGVNVSVF